jgi:predicted permease
VVTLALGIGANTAIFSLIDGLMLRYLPVRNPHELVQLKFQLPGATGSGNASFSHAIVRALADRREIFEGVAGFSGYTFRVGTGDAVRKVDGALVAGDYYETFGLRPELGRLLTRHDDEVSAPLVMVISYGFWERQFFAEPGAIGSSLIINGMPVTIVGVSTPGFVGANVGSIADITMAASSLRRIDAATGPLLSPGNFWMRIIARPPAGVTPSQATARLQTAWSGLWDSVIATHWPASRRREFANARFILEPGGTGWTLLRERYQQPLMVLMAVVAFVLLIACANVAGLMLARATARQREIAVRLAIGAGRSRIIRQLLTESTLLSLIGAAVGVMFAWSSSRLLVSLISTGSLRVTLDLTPNTTVLLFTTAVAVATGVLFGLAPAWQLMTPAWSSAWNEDGRVTSARSRLLSVLIAGQVGLSLLLLVGAGLFIQTLQNMQRFDPGFRHEGVLIVDLQGRRTAIPEGVVDDVRRLPGVISASMSTHTPLSGAVWSDIALPRGQALPERDTAYFIGAGPRFFETMQTRLLAGREFDDRDSRDAPPVAIINKAYASQHFPHRNPVGETLGAVVRGERRDLQIVGVAEDTSAAGLRNTPPPTVYVSYRQLSGDFPTTLEVRASGSLAQLAASLGRVVQQRLPEATVEVLPLSTQIGASMFQERLMAALSGAFGTLALVLACVGLYGLMAYTVVRRTREMGIRLALGSPRSRVIGMVLKNALRLVVAGVLLGLPGVWLASRSVRSMLFGLNPADPATVIVAVSLLMAAGLLAAYIPAQRAASVDPLAALRCD